MHNMTWILWSFYKLPEEASYLCLKDRLQYCICKIKHVEKMESTALLFLNHWEVISINWDWSSFCFIYLKPVLPLNHTVAHARIVRSDTTPCFQLISHGTSYVWTCMNSLSEVDLKSDHEVAKNKMMDHSCLCPPCSWGLNHLLSFLLKLLVHT